MNIIFCEDYEELSRKSAAIIAAQLTLKPDSVLGLATGSTPEGMYQNLAARCHNGEISFSGVKTYNLDEYVGLPPRHSQSYAYFMDKHLFSKVDIRPGQFDILSGIAADPEAECRRYTEALESLPSGLDIQVLGIGNNGHIGFNEPGDQFIPDTHCVDLADSTIDANARFFLNRGEVPKQALTMGVRPIMRASQLLLLAGGAAKSEILEAALFGPVTPRVPASILQLHGGLIVVADRAALSAVMARHPQAIL